MRLHEMQREAHMTNDAALLVSVMADSMTVVQDGVISKNSKGDIEEMFSSYFQQVKYRKWDDISEPVLDISADGTLATIIVDKLSEAAFINGDSLSANETTYWAWMSSYRKESNGEWKLYALASGRKPPE